jgi:serine phosphatase RsbU (regulator of sigma subunit)
LIANAGAPPTLLARMNGTCEPLEPNGSMLLGMADEITLEEITATLTPGDRLLFATDGLYDQRCPAAQPFAYEPCKAALTRADSIVDCVAALRLMFDMHRADAPRDDDMTGIIIGVVPTTKRT